MHSKSATKPVMAACLSISLTGCGLAPPQLAEAWEAQDVSREMAYNIKKNIICETIDAIRKINSKSSSVGPPIPADYSVQLQLTLTMVESSGLSPSLTYNRVFPSGSESGISIGRNLNLGLSGELSATATRTDTTYSYWQVGKIAGPGKNENLCAGDHAVDRRGSSPLLTSNLGILPFLEDQVMSTILLSSSRPVGKKPDKIDVYSYALKFAVVSSLGINPSFKLVSLSGAGAPILNLGRTRTHELLLTFGPSTSDGFQPSDISISQHLTTQQNIARRFGP